tara:strand:+ start:9367 stop:9675 length:309 start_codon:yes stop_codon:yes gene_type:complete
MNKLVVDFAVSAAAQEVELTAAEIAFTEEEQNANPTVAARLMLQLREMRNKKLAETDWTQCADVPDGIKNAYVSYRQQLRDITNTYNDPTTVVWPDKPEVSQ